MPDSVVSTSTPTPKASVSKTTVTHETPGGVTTTVVPVSSPPGRREKWEDHSRKQRAHQASKLKPSGFTSITGPPWVREGVEPDRVGIEDGAASAAS